MKTLGLVLALALLSSACGPPSTDLAGTTTGIIVEYVPAEGIDGSIAIFRDGEQVEIVVSADTSLEFPNTHIQEHRLTGEPVSVDWLETNGTKQAIAITDA